MSASRSRAQLPSFTTCWLLLALADAALRLGGLRCALRLADRLAPPVEAAARAAGGGTPAAVPARVALATARRVAAAGSFYPRRALCVEQSLVLLVLLRRRGIAAVLRLGVQPLPFLAHAWVEVAGTPVNEPPDLVAQLVAFPVAGV